jgi:hypothetical protein
MFRFSIRELVLLTAAFAIWFGWAIDCRLNAGSREYIAQLRKENARLLYWESEMRTACAAEGIDIVEIRGGTSALHLRLPQNPTPFGP